MRRATHTKKLINLASRQAGIGNTASRPLATSDAPINRKQRRQITAAQRRGEYFELGE